MNEEDFAQQVDAAISFGDPKQLKILRTRAVKFGFKKQSQLLDEVLSNKKKKSWESFAKKNSYNYSVTQNRYKNHKWTSKKGKVYQLDSRSGPVSAPKDFYTSLTNEDVSKLMERKGEEISNDIINAIAKRTGTSELVTGSKAHGQEMHVHKVARANCHIH